MSNQHIKNLSTVFSNDSLLNSFFVGALILCFMIPSKIEAQRGLNLNEVLTTLENMEVFIKSRENKKMAEDLVKSAGQLPLTTQEYNELKSAYIDFADVYNNQYLAYIKRDISNIQRIKQMVRSPRNAAQAAEQYLAYFRVVYDQYNQDLLPRVSSIQEAHNMGQGDIGLLLRIGKEAFNAIVDIIKKRGEGRDAQLQVALDMANRLLFDKLAMPHWDDLGIRQPSNGTTQAVGQSAPPTFQPVPALPKTESTVSIPMIESVSGQVDFKVYNANTGGADIMNFSTGIPNPNTATGGYRDMVIGAPPSPAAKNVFSSDEAFPNNTYYKLEATGNGLIYVFAINSGNKMYSMYPDAGATTSLPNRIKFMGDMVIGTPPSSGTPEQSVVKIPSQQYIQIIDKPGMAPPSAETLVIIVSKSELNIKSILQQMEAIPTTVGAQDRLAQVLGNKLVGGEQASATFANGSLNYSLGSSNTEVLPLVFNLRRR